MGGGYPPDPPPPVSAPAVLKPQGWYNAIDFPALLSETNTNKTDNNGAGHADFTAFSTNQQAPVKLMKAEQAKYTGGKTHVLRFTPRNDVFHLNKFLVPNVQTGIQLYFNSPDLFLNGVGVAGRLRDADIKVRMYLCQVRINPSVYRELAGQMEKGIVVYPTVRSEVRTLSLARGQRQYECINLSQDRIPNRVLIGLVSSEAFNGNVLRDPFCFQKFGLSSPKQTVKGEEYLYETLELVHNDGTKDLRGFYRFLQATGCLCRYQGNMLKDKDWGQGKNCTLLAFDNAANGCLDSPVLNPKQAGVLRYVLNFVAATTENLTAIVFGEFENLLEIDKNKAMLYDIYQR